MSSAALNTEPKQKPKAATFQLLINTENEKSAASDETPSTNADVKSTNCLILAPSPAS